MGTVPIGKPWPLDVQLKDPWELITSIPFHMFSIVGRVCLWSSWFELLVSETNDPGLGVTCTRSAQLEAATTRISPSHAAAYTTAHARPRPFNRYITVFLDFCSSSTRRDYLCAPRAVTQSSLSPVTPNRERAPLVFCLSRTRPRRCSLERVCRICGPVPLTFTRVAPNPCRYFAAVLAGYRSLHPRTYTERVKAAPYNRKPGWVGYASSSFD
jgi:hypothetical protein